MSAARPAFAKRRALRVSSLVLAVVLAALAAFACGTTALGCAFWDMGEWSDRAGLATEDAGAETGAPVAEAGVDADAGPIPVIARDTFSRALDGGLGIAEIGGAWVLAGESAFSVDGQAGLVTIVAARTVYAELPAVASDDVDIELLTKVDKLAAGGIFVSVIGRGISVNESYSGRLVLRDNGQVSVGIARRESGDEIVLQTVVAPFQILPNEVMKTRVQVTGTAPTQIRVKAWMVKGPEPAAWTLDVTDVSPNLQKPGAVGIRYYLSSSATNGPVRILLDDVLARPASRLR